MKKKKKKKKCRQIYQLSIVIFHNIPIGNVKILVPNIFDKKRTFPIIKTELYLKLGLS